MVAGLEVGYGVAVAGLSAVGYAKTGSDKSIKAGLGSCAALLLASAVTGHEGSEELGATLGLVIALALSAVFTLRWSKVEDKVPPADPVGVMTHPSGLLALSLLAAAAIGAAKGGL